MTSTRQDREILKISDRSEPGQMEKSGAWIPASDEHTYN